MALIKSEADIAIMAEAGRRLAHVLARVRDSVRAGIRPVDLDALAKKLIEEGGDAPAFLGYTPGGTEKPYPATLCVSKNDVVVHGVPDTVPLRDGDVVKLDLGLVHEGWYADAACTVIIGSVSQRTHELVAVTEEALAKGIAAAVPGNTVGDIGHAVQAFVEEHGFGVVRALTGHGVGRELHEDPNVPNYGKAGEGHRLEPGMVIAIEPMVSAGNYKVVKRPDDGYATADGSLSAHFEHTVAITKEGPKILTIS